jgi:hypothetical protein
MFANKEVSIDYRKWDGNIFPTVYISVTCNDGDLDKLMEVVVVSISEPDTTVVGVDAIDVPRPADWQAKLLMHLLNIRALPNLQNCLFIMDVQSPSGFTADQVKAFVKKEITHVFFTNKLDTSKFGSVKIKEFRKKLMEDTRMDLNRRNCQVFQYFVTSHQDRDALLKKFKDEMLRYKETVRPKPHSDDGSVLTNYTKGCNLVYTFQRAIRARNLILTE